jgi:hypothetical protein
MEGPKVDKTAGQPPKKAVRHHYRGPIATVAKTEASFQGRCDDLKGHILDCVGGRQADQYAATMKEIAAYIGTKYTYGADIRWSLEHEKEFVIPKPTPLAASADDIDKRIWEKEIDEYVKRKSKLQSSCRTLFSLIHGKCTEYLKAKLEALAVKWVTFCLEDSRYHLDALHDAKIRFYTLRQGKNMDNAKYLELFKTHVAVVEQFGGSVTRDPIIMLRELEVLGIDKDSATKAEILKARKVGEDKYLGMALVKGADRMRYSRLMDDLINQFTMGHKNYPQNVTAGYNLLINYRVTGQSTARIINYSESMSFATVEKERRDLTLIRCFRCQKKGHFANHCPEIKKEEGAVRGTVTTEALQQLMLADPPMDMMTTTTSPFTNRSAT